jgi:outer membrane protein assembly factor BamB
MWRFVGCGLLVLCVSQASAENWPGWRGPRGDGTSQETNLPTKWDGATGENIAWKVPLPGEGHSSPVIWENRIFLASCLPESEERVLFCLDAANGKTLWKQTVLKSKLETKHALNSRASCTPATDGKQVYVAFLEIDGRTIPAPNVGTPREITPGEIVVAAYDFEGNAKWKQKVGKFISAHGFSSNPVLFEDLVILNGDHDGDGYLVALDRESGKERWRTKREHGIRSYVTPIIRQIENRTQMVLSGSQSVASYDPRSGKSHWKMEGPTEQFVASMVFDGQLFFLTCGYPDYHIVAIRPTGEGDVTDTHIAWRTTKGAAYVTSPIVVGKHLLVISDGGVASCFDSTTGERHWMERLGGKFSASPITAGGLVYAVNDSGVTSILEPGREFKKPAECKLGEDCSSSPAASAGRLFIRTHGHLFAIGKGK